MKLFKNNYECKLNNSIIYIAFDFTKLYLYRYIICQKSVLNI